MGHNRPPLEYFVTSSQNSLESFELSRLNQASNLRKELRQILDEWVEAEVDSRIARWILECRRADSPHAASTIASIVDPARHRQLEMTFASRSAKSMATVNCSGQTLPQPELATCFPDFAEAEASSAGADDVAPFSCRTGSCVGNFEHAQRSNSVPLPTPNQPNADLPRNGDTVHRVLQTIENLEDSGASTLPPLAQFDGTQSDIEPSAPLLSFEPTPLTASPAGFEIRPRRVNTRIRSRQSCRKPGKIAKIRWPQPEPCTAQQTTDPVRSGFAIDGAVAR